MIVRTCCVAMLLGISGGLLTERSWAQDVPGIEICTAEKDMVRRTSCLQSNVDFLKKTMTQASMDSQRKIDAANRQIDALKNAVVALQKSVEELQAAQKKPEPPAQNKDAIKEGAEGAKNGVTK